MFIGSKIDVPDLADAPVKSSSLLVWIWYFLKPCRNLFIFLTLNRGLRRIFFAASPLALGKLLEYFETGQAFRDPSCVWNLATAYSIAASVVFVLLMLCTEEAGLADRTSRVVRLLGLQQLNRLSVRWLEQSDSGGKLQKITNGATCIRNLIRLFFQAILAFIASFSGAVLTVLGMNLPRFYILCFVGMMLSFTSFAAMTSSVLDRGYDTQNQLLEKLMGKVYAFVNAATTVKIFNLGEHVLASARQGEEEGLTQVRKIYFLDYGRWVILNFIGYFWVALIIGIGIHQTLAHQITAAALTMAAYQAWAVWDFLDGFVMIYDQIIENRSAARQFIDLLRIEPPHDEEAKAPFEQGDISFNNIRFSYNTGKTVLDGFQLTVHAGEKVGVVGRSGSGKSTLVKLLLKFYDPDENEITIDRQNIRLIDPTSLRQNIAVVPQSPTLFNESILENIRCGRLDATDDQVIEAAKIAHAHGFIEGLPQAYQTLVGEDGAKLSGGQKQRIAIARAVLKQSPIIIMDEATSALDSESEKLIQASLCTILRNRTVIAIAHRLSTITMMDRLIVLDNGHIVETGTHRQLIDKNGFYTQLWKAQSGGFIPEIFESADVAGR